MQSKIAAQKVQPHIYQNPHRHPQPKVVTAKRCLRQFPHPLTLRVPGAGLSRQDHVPIHASCTIALGKSLQVGRGTSSAPPARAPPPPGWPPAARVSLTCRRSVAGCHIFQPRGLAEQTLARLGRSRQGARGCGPALHLGSVSAGGASWIGRRPPGGRRGRRAGGGGAALCCRQLVGTAARRLSWRSCQRTAQLRPGPRAHGGGGGGDRSLLLPRRRRRPDLRALSMPGAAARPRARTPEPRGAGAQPPRTPHPLEGREGRPQPAALLPAEAPRGLGSGEGTDWLGRTGPGERGLPRERNRSPLGGSQASVQQAPVTCLALCWATDFHSFFPLQLTEQLLCPSLYAGF